MSFDYYLGANTPNGFVSCFSGMTDAVSRLYIIKGGPGCGKSTAMKRIADRCGESGMAVERIWCSSDTDSLDGIYLPDLDTMYVDGTAPHVIDPNCPGARDGIVNFGDFWDEGALEKQRGEIESVSRRIFGCYGKAYRYLRAAGEISALWAQEAQQAADTERLYRRARRIAARHIPSRRGVTRGRQIDVFFDSLSPAGPVFLNDFSDYEICELHDGAGLYPLVTGSVLESALSSGYLVYAAHDPFFPQDAPLHLVIPELSFAVLTSGGTFGCPPTGQRRLRLDKMSDSGGEESAVVRKKRDMACYMCLIRDAEEMLGEAKRLHDELENYYRPTVDFRAVDALVDRHCEALLGEFRRKSRDFRSL